MRTPTWEGVFLEDGLRWISLPVSGAQALTCQRATREFLINVSEMPFRWKADHEVCANGWGCQDTLILIDNGEKSPVGLKGDSHPSLGETSLPSQPYCVV